MKTQELKERRRLPRLSFQVPIQFRNILKPQEPFHKSVTRDVSASGVRMSSKSFVPVEDRVVLLLSLPGQLKPIRAVARVIWTEQRRFTAVYDCGLEFLEIAAQDQQTIAGYVERGVVTR